MTPTSASAGPKDGAGGHITEQSDSVPLSQSTAEKNRSRVKPQANNQFIQQRKDDVLFHADDGVGDDDFNEFNENSSIIFPNGNK